MDQPAPNVPTGYEQTKKNTIRVYKDRGKYDFQTIRSILASTLVSTVSFVVCDGEDEEFMPFSLPMTAIAAKYTPTDRKVTADDSNETDHDENHGSRREAFDVYLHGNAAMLLNKLVTERGSVRVCITSTKVDGVVLHFAPNGHSLNYRSCVLHGMTTRVTDLDEKYYAMQALTNHMSRKRWSSVNPVSPRAMAAVQVLKVRVESGSAKIRAANVNGLEKEGFGPREDVYTGVVPLYEVLGEPIGSGYHPDRPVQPEIHEWIERRNRTEREYAEGVAKIP